MAQARQVPVQSQTKEQAQPKPRPVNPKSTPNQQRPRPRSTAQAEAQNDQASSAKERERKEQAAQAAQKSLRAQREAKQLIQAAGACGDPEERQKLLNRALEKEVEAETFGKTAKYLQTGAFQGLCAGAGLGGGIGVSLGVITGTLVGGTTGIVTGGLGAGLGLGIGAMHGPWFKVGDLMGKGIRKITGDLPGWKATEEQKSALEKMVNGVKESDRPADDDLIRMSEEGGVVEAGKGYTGQRQEDEKQKGVLQSTPGYVASGVSSLSSTPKSKTANAGPQTKSRVDGAATPGTQSDPRVKRQYNELAGQAVTPSTEAKRPSTSAGDPGAGAKRKPKKLEVRSARAEAT